VLADDRCFCFSSSLGNCYVHEPIRTGNASDVEQQQLEVLSAHKAAEVAVQASSLACPGLVPPLSRALELAVLCGDGEAVNMLSAAVSSCAAAELPQLVRRVARDEAQRGGGAGGEATAAAADSEAWATLPQLLRLLLAASQQRVDRSACVLTMEPWHRFHDAVMDCAAAAAAAAPSSPGAALSPAGAGSASASAMPRWLQDAESALREAVRAVLGTTRYPVGYGPASGTDEDDVEAFSDWRKEVCAYRKRLRYIVSRFLIDSCVGFVPNMIFLLLLVFLSCCRTHRCEIGSEAWSFRIPTPQPNKSNLAAAPLWRVSARMRGW